MRGRLSYLADSVRTAASNIHSSKVRSLLTIVIVALGVTSLVGSQTAIDSLAALLQSAFGTNEQRISITAAKASSGRSKARPVGISYIEASEFASVAGLGSCTVYTWLPPLTQVSGGAGRLGPQTTILAYEGDYLGCNALEVGEGRSPGPSAAECMVGKKVASQMGRSGGSVLGEQLYIGGHAYSIAGIISQQSSLLGVLNDNTIFIPLQSALGSLVGERAGYSIDLTIPKEDYPGNATSLAEALMRRIRHLGSDQKSDFEIVEGSAAVREIERLGGSLKYIALIIGLLTLCGAAVALANIMLICVAERTREVGIRRAVGATRGDIRTGFVCEALLICEAGCLAGTLLGIACGNILSAVTHSGFTVPWDWLILSQVISLATGVAACALPARRAARIDVVEALRCE